MDDTSYEEQVPEDELEAVRRELAALAEAPLPPAVAARLDVRLAAELASTPLSARRARRRRLQAGASLSAAAAVAAVLVLAFGLRGGGHPAPEAAALRTTAAPASGTATADSSAKVAAGKLSVAPKACPPASRTGGGRPTAACPGARGGHARAV